MFLLSSLPSPSGDITPPGDAKEAWQIVRLPATGSEPSLPSSGREKNIITGDAMSFSGRLHTGVVSREVVRVIAAHRYPKKA
ncbi:hypothetical protein TNCV_4102821 [Trichonephila clavipes]|nr:hypothetical protein TNCV_4102821 [Trichonephila clavipes]